MAERKLWWAAYGEWKRTIYPPFDWNGAEEALRKKYKLPDLMMKAVSRVFSSNPIHECEYPGRSIN